VHRIFADCSLNKMEQDWPFGIERTPEGERAREFVQRTPVWSSAVFISESGAAYRRFMSSLGSTSWELIPLASDPVSGRFGYLLPGFVALETALATAWHPRAPGSRGRAYVIDPSAEVDVFNVAWREPEVVLEDEEEVEAETWQPLRWSIGVASCDGLGFQLSSLGRLRQRTTRDARICSARDAVGGDAGWARRPHGGGRLAEARGAPRAAFGGSVSLVFRRHPSCRARGPRGPLE
jgi:hypothetical protein